MLWFITPNFLATLSKLAPIEIGAISVFPFVLSREVPEERERVHELIHQLQQGEVAALQLLSLALLVVGGAVPVSLALMISPALFFFGGIAYLAIYYGHYGVNLYRGMSGEDAYNSICMEQEAFANECDAYYLEVRPLFAWVR